MISFNLLNQVAFRRAQAACDHQMPPEDAAERCESCDGSGVHPAGGKCMMCGGNGWVCRHDWHKFPGEAKDGTKLARCRKCGLEIEV